MNTATSANRGEGEFDVALIDAQTVSRMALQLLLPELRFTGVFPTTEDFLCAPRSASVVIMDLHLAGTGQRPAKERMDAVRAVVSAGYRVLVYTDVRTGPLLVSCLKAGARGVVHKAESIADLLSAVRTVASGQTLITTALAGLAELADRRHLIPRLSPRQKQLLAARARGEQFDSIAARLFITKKVAEEHWSLVAAKFADFLQTRSPADLERLLGLDPGDLLDWHPGGD